MEHNDQENLNKSELENYMMEHGYLTEDDIKREAEYVRDENYRDKPLINTDSFGYKIFLFLIDLPLIYLVIRLIEGEVTIRSYCSFLIFVYIMRFIRWVFKKKKV